MKLQGLMPVHTKHDNNKCIVLKNVHIIKEQQSLHHKYDDKDSSFGSLSYQFSQLMNGKTLSANQTHSNLKGSK